MKKLILFFVTQLLFLFVLHAQNIGIGTTTPNASALLDLQSNTKGLAIPRMTLAQRNAISSPVTGLMVYQTDNTPGFYFYSGSAWTQLSTGWSVNGLNVYNNTTGSVGIGTINPTAPLGFPNVVGNKISFWNSGPNNDYGIGVNLGVFQFYTGGQDRIAFGYGNANNFTETLGIHTGTGMLAYPNVLGNKISFWRSGPNNDFGIGLNTGVLQLYTAGQDQIAFGYGNSNAFTETMRYYTGSGQLCLGTTTPQAKLHIAKDNEALRFTGSQSYLTFFNGTTSAAYVGYLANVGAWDMELGTSYLNSAGSLKLSIQGNPAITIHSDGEVDIAHLHSSILYFGPSNDRWQMIKANGNLEFILNGSLQSWIANDGEYVQYSDARLKEGMMPYKSVINDIKKLNVLTYYYKNNKSDRRSFGLIAQNVAAYFPEIVSESFEKDGKKYLGLDYSKTGVLAIKAIQEQQVIIETQQKKIENLEKRLAALEKMIGKQ